jgi:xylan 1,4-beta-xylosidase
VCLEALLAAFAAHAQPANPILAGDHPDPTIIRAGNTYWTTSTSGNWAPQFPLYRSTDLHHWTAAGAVFPHTPEWATGDFWAPELVADQGRILLFYVARKRGGSLCVAAATAAAPQGPYTDHGPVLCEPDGSIDPSFVRDEKGQPFLIWKEDGNSIGKPTPIWAQPLSSDLLHLTGSRTQLLVNDPASWEGGVVEGPFIFRHQGKFFLFYAGNACCGVKCDYAEGVARATHLLGPWTKDPANPIIRPNGAWKCPGHGTAVHTASGSDYLLYHAYPSVGTVYLGRESVLDRITWNSDDWPEVNSGRGPSGGSVPGQAASRQAPFADNFDNQQLDPEWKWPIGHPPAFHVGQGQLTLEPSADQQPVFVGRSLTANSYVATVGLVSDPKTDGGLAIIGDRRNQVLLAVREGGLELSRKANGKDEVVWRSAMPAFARTVWLRVSSTQAHASFSYSLDRVHWTEAGAASDLAGLPPWDQGLRIGLVANSSPGTHASFVRFTLDDAKN